MTFNDVLQPNSQLIKSNIALSLDNNLIFENWEEVELFMDTYSEQHGFENKRFVLKRIKMDNWKNVGLAANIQESINQKRAYIVSISFKYVLLQ